MVEPTHIEPYSVTAQSRLISVNKRQKGHTKDKKSNFEKKKREKMPGSTTSLNSTSSNETTTDEWDDFDATEILKLFPKQHVGQYKNNGIYTVYTPSSD